ncbi:unnamed protein product, partial [marine sediment metagenome]
MPYALDIPSFKMRPRGRRLRNPVILAINRP